MPVARCGGHGNCRQIQQIDEIRVIPPFCVQRKRIRFNLLVGVAVARRGKQHKIQVPPFHFIAWNALAAVIESAPRNGLRCYRMQSARMRHREIFDRRQTLCNPRPLVGYKLCRVVKDFEVKLNPRAPRVSNALEAFSTMLALIRRQRSEGTSARGRRNETPSKPTRAAARLVSNTDRHYRNHARRPAQDSPPRMT